MNLLGAPFLVLVAAVTVLVPTGAALMWNRWPSRIAWPARAVALLLVMVMGAGAAATLVNRQFGFYGTVGDLLGTSALTYRPPQSFSTSAGAGADQVEMEEANWYAIGKSEAAAGHGLLAPVLLPGRRSGLVRHGFVYLPPTWFLDPGVSLPVIEMLHGYPGSPGNFRVQLDIQGFLDTEIAARRMPPAVTVFPNTYERGHASECVNAVKGQAVETYLAVDVPNDVQATFGTSHGRALGLLGYSEGGFCAVNLGLHHPDRVSAAVSLAGYFTAGGDRGTKALYGRRHDALLRNSPSWWVRHRAPTGPAMLLVSGSLDLESMQQDRVLASTAHRYAAKLPVEAVVVPAGAHNFATFKLAMPAALDFLGLHLPGPLAKLQVLPRDTNAYIGPIPATLSATPSATPSGTRSGTPRPTSSARTPRPTASARIGPVASPRPSRTPSPTRPTSPSPQPHPT